MGSQAQNSKAGGGEEEWNEAEPLDQLFSFVKEEITRMLQNLDAVIEKCRSSAENVEFSCRDLFGSMECFWVQMVVSRTSFQKGLDERLYQLCKGYVKFKNSSSASSLDIKSQIEAQVGSSLRKAFKPPSQQENHDLGCERPIECTKGIVCGTEWAERLSNTEDGKSTKKDDVFDDDGVPNPTVLDVGPDISVLCRNPSSNINGYQSKSDECRIDSTSCDSDHLDETSSEDEEATTRAVPTGAINGQETGQLPDKQCRQLLKTVQHRSQSNTNEYSADAANPGRHDQFPKPKIYQDFEIVVGDEETSDVELVDTVDSFNVTDVENLCTSHVANSDSGLNMKDLRVMLERLPAEVYDAVKDRKAMHLHRGEDEGNDEYSSNINDNGALLKALKSLRALNARMTSVNRGNISCDKRNSTGSARHLPEKSKNVVEEKCPRYDCHNSTDGSDVEIQVVSPRPGQSIPSREPVPNLNGYQPKSAGSCSSCDSDYLEGTSSGEEAAARRAVLRGTALKPEPNTLKKSGTAKRKKETKYYYTPRMCRIPSLSDTEDDSDCVIVTSKKNSIWNRIVILSDSSDDTKEDKKVRKKIRRDAELIELPSGSDSSSSSRRSKSLAVDVADGKRNRIKTDPWNHETCAAPRSNFRVSQPLTQLSSRRPKIYTSSDSEMEDFNASSQSKANSESVKLSAVEVVDVTNQDSGDEKESQNSTYRGRKNIREILNRSALMKETREAEKNEELRRKRLARRQAEFNKGFNAPKVVNLSATEIVLDFDPKTKEPLVTVDPLIVKKLKPHQAEGVRFMWNNCFESVEQYKAPQNLGSGCILAHCMGLGKTFQTIAFVHTILTSEALNVKTVLIICPISTIHNWHREFQMWLGDVSGGVLLHKFEFQGQPMVKRIESLEMWKKRGGVGIIPFTMFRNLVYPKNPSKRMISAEARESIESCLFEPGADVVIFDEGHILKNESSKVFLSVNRMRTRRRVVLTGTPLQNNLMEYYTMMSFVKPNLLGTRKEFANRFSNPITNGQHKDSTPSDVRLMKNRAHVLHKKLEVSVQRLDHSILSPYLPPKLEYAIIIHMSDIQKKLYNGYLNRIDVSKKSDIANRILSGFFFADYSWLDKIWSHPFNLTVPKVKDRKKKKKINVEEPLEDDVNDELEFVNPAYVRRRELIDAEMEAFEKRHREWWLPYFEDPLGIKNMVHSSKCVILMEILETCAHIGDKVLVFSQYLYSLNIIEHCLQVTDDEARERIAKGEDQDDVSRWRKGIDYLRLDGSVKSFHRQRYFDSFNDENSKAKLFLISTRTGGLGINLVGANRVVLFDVSFNPAIDMQGIFRVFRFGQTKPCYIYRLICRGTMEEKVYNRQVVKISLSRRVVDEEQILRHFTHDELTKMYLPIEEEEGPSPPYDVPKDRLLLDLLLSRKSMISTFLEHDSLLQNQLDEKLTDEERQAAWDEYEKEKNGKKLAEGSESKKPTVEPGGSPKAGEEGCSSIGKKLKEAPSNRNETESDRCADKVSGYHG